MRYVVLCATLLAAAPAKAETPSRVDSPHPWGISLLSSSAIGVSNAGFFNQLVGVRVDYRFTPRYAFGGLLSYANLKGKDGRVHNLLPEAALQYRVPYDGERFGLPVRIVLGYLPKNGPTLRLGGGVDFALASRVSLEITPLEAMIWVTRERPEVSMNGSLAVRAAF